MQHAACRLLFDNGKSRDAGDAREPMIIWEDKAKH
jgi:hypothetical protein